MLHQVIGLLGNESPFRKSLLFEHARATDLLTFEFFLDMMEDGERKHEQLFVSPSFLLMFR